jgi:Protein of unknown function (DUF3667)
MSKQDKPTHCAGCGTELLGKFCHKCGEKRLNRSDYSLQGFVADVFEKFTHFDSKFARSFKALVWPPGRMTADYLNGRRKRYVKPLSFFFVINLIYFLSIGWNAMRTYESPLQNQFRNPYGALALRMTDARLAGAADAERQAFETRFDAQNHLLSKSLLVLMAPMLAAGLALLFFRKKWYFGEHLIAALHLHSLLVLTNIVVGILLRGNIVYGLTGYPVSGLWLELLEPLFLYTALSAFTFRTVYGAGAIHAGLKGLSLGFIYFTILVLYRFLLFLISFYASV